MKIRIPAVNDLIKISYCNACSHFKKSMSKGDKMSRFDKLFLKLTIGFIPPVLLFLAFWWGSLVFIKDSTVFKIAGLGFLLGILIDVLFIKRWIQSAYQMHPLLLIMIYLFYTIGMFGFFMGVPIFNVFNGVIAGIFIGRKLKNTASSNANPAAAIKKVSLLSTFIMFFICTASAAIALADPYTAANLEGMFHLNFKITQTILYEIIAIGGLFLITSQYWITKITGKYVLKLS